MKKRIISVLLVLSMVMALVPMFAIAGSAATTRETAWYLGDSDTTTTEYTISTPERLLGFSDLIAGGATFAGKTIKLGADIDLNSTWTASATAPDNVWATIDGLDGEFFQGTFDGQGHTVSGIYMSATEAYAGIFGSWIETATSTIKNLAIVNSYLTTTSASFGGIVGGFDKGKTTIQNVYIDATVVSTADKVGGLVGWLRAGELAVDNSIFAGDVYTSATGNTYTGGFVGYVARYQNTTSDNYAKLTFTNSAMYGNVQGVNYTAGFVGRLGHGGACYIDMSAENCIVAGNITSAGTNYVASYYGGVNTTNTIANQGLKLSFTNCYHTTVTANGTSVVKTFVGTAPSDVSKCYGVTDAELMAMTNAELEAKGFTDWVQTKSYPMPDYVIEMFPELIIDERVTKWYEANSATKEYTITTAGELLGFSDLLASGETFSGWTITLGNDIDLNPTWTASATAPDNVWATIDGLDGEFFQGTFDGQGHTISGIYMSATETYAGIFGSWTDTSTATIKNLAIVNSYLTTTVSTIGGIVGGFDKGKTTIQNVYFDATIASSAQYVGGFAGWLRAGELAVDNSIFAGDVSSTYTSKDAFVGGFVGYVARSAQATSDNKAVLTFTTSAMYGSVNGKYASGLVGRLGHGGACYIDMTVTDCVVAGEVIQNGTVTNYGGSFYGGMHSSGTVSITLTRCYYTSDQPIPTYSNAPQPATGSTYTSVADGKLIGTLDNVSELQGFTATGGYPRPTAMITAGVATSIYDRATGWYLGDSDATTTEYTISTPEQLLGFSDLLASGATFKGKTIKLGADINLNPAWSASAAIPANTWSATVGADNSFLGVFNGQGHTVSGIFLNVPDETTYSGIFGGTLGSDVTIKDVKIVNSYLSQYKAAGGLFGGMTAGTLTIDNVYLDAKMTFRNQFIGGFVGWQLGGTLNISNSVFVGEAVSTLNDRAYLGGFVGYIGHKTYATSTNPSVTNISNSEFTGSLTARYVGGFIGRIGHTVDCYSTVNMTDCVSSGSIISWEEKVGGSLYGGTYVKDSGQSQATITITNCYYNDILEISGDALASQNLWTGSLSATDGTNTYTSIKPANISTIYYKSAAADTDTTLGGYQHGIAEDTSGDIRLIGLVNVPESKTVTESYKSFGFEIKMFNKNGDKWTNLENDVIPAIYNLYTSVNANDETVTAETLGGDYVFLSTVSGIPSFVGEVTFVIRTFYDDADGNRVFGETTVIRYDTDRVTVTGLTGKLYGEYVSNGEQYQQAYTGATSEDFDAYVTALVAAGYTMYSENTIGENRYATYVTKDNEVNLVYFGGNVDRLYVTKNARGYLPATTAPEYTKLMDSTVTQIAREGAANDAPGNSYIVQLEDGSFVIIDGGPANDNDEAALLAFLQENKPESHDKPKVVWMLTHLHNDHAELAIEFLEANSANIELSLICYSFPNADMLTEAACAKNYNKIKALSELYPDAQTYAFHTGQKLLLPGCEIEFLYTQAEHWLVMDGNGEVPFTTANDTCATWRMTFTGGNSFLVLGDSEEEMCQMITTIYGEYLESDVLQVCHHGQNGSDDNGVILALYQKIDPKVCLWPTTESNTRLMLYKMTKYNQFLLNNQWTRGDSEAGDRTHYYADVTATVNMSDLSVVVSTTTAS